jgi:hypothetical protein
MARWLIFAAWNPDDTALWNSFWIAEQTARLTAEPALRLEREAAVRTGLESALADSELRGVALFGHGRPHAVMGSDGHEALDAANVALISGRWAHAIACNTGQELALAAAVHADIFVGYNVALIVGWTLENRPGELRDRLARMVTATTLALLEGVRAKTELMRRAAAAADEVTEWLLENTDDGYLGLHVFAQQLVDRMVVSR